jgi:hypothetical protein
MVSKTEHTLLGIEGEAGQELGAAGLEREMRPESYGLNQG